MGAAMGFISKPFGSSWNSAVEGRGSVPLGPSAAEEAMLFVGEGGDIAPRVKWRHVGEGMGNFTPGGQRRLAWWVRIALWVLAAAMLLGLLAACVLLGVHFLSGRTTTSTVRKGPTAPAVVYTTPPTTEAPKMTPPPPRPGLPHEPGFCVFWGDPHIETFDDAYSNFYTPGEVWVVNSEKVKIQARFNGTSYTPINLASTTGIAIGGPFIGGNLVEISPVEQGLFQINGMDVKEGPDPAYTTSLPGTSAQVRYNSVGRDPDGHVESEGWKEPHRVVHLVVPEYSVNVQVFRWANYLDVRIAMSPQPGQDGVCGNLNKQWADDRPDAVMRRGALAVKDEDLLFKTARVSQELDPRMVEMIRKDCTNVDGEDRLQLSMQECRGDHHGLTFEACVFNMCFGVRDVWVERTATKYATPEERKRLFAVVG